MKDRSVRVFLEKFFPALISGRINLVNSHNAVFLLLSIQAARRHGEPSRIHKGGNGTMSAPSPAACSFPLKTTIAAARDVDFRAGSILHSTPAAASPNNFHRSLL